MAYFGRYGNMGNRHLPHLCFNPGPLGCLSRLTRYARLGREVFTLWCTSFNGLDAPRVRQE